MSRRLPTAGGTAIVLALLAVAAAAQPPPCPEKEPQRMIDLEVVLEGSFSAIEDRRREVIADAESWRARWTEIHHHLEPKPALPEVDFAHERLILVAAGTQPSGGYAIAVESAARRGDCLEILVLTTCPTADAMVAFGLSQPLQIVRVRDRAARQVFRERTQDCDANEP